MNWKNIRLIFLREVRDQLRDRRTLFMITILPVLLYPMLGLGLVEMMLTFSEQRRTVVILNADELPDDPAFLTETGIDSRWLSAGGTGTPITVITDLEEPPKSKPASSTRRGRSRDELLTQAGILAEHVQRATANNAADNKERTSDQTIRQLESNLSSLFNGSGIEVLMLVPDGYRDSVHSVQRYIGDASGESVETADVPGLVVVRNSADDKSVAAFSVVQSALRSWEAHLRKSIFDEASLPESLQYPARLQWVEVAHGEQVAANVWSKLFPAMLVIMALTGAFYPAIDLARVKKNVAQWKRC